MEAAVEESAGVHPNISEYIMSLQILSFFRRTEDL